MPYFFSPFLALCLFCFAGTLSSYGDEVGKVPTQVQSLFGTYCIECHRDGADASEFRLDASLTGDFSSLGTRARWGEIVNVLNSHEMPPEDEPQPPTDMVSGVVDWITAQLVAAERELRENRVVMRRLNRNEYRNSVRDLTGVEPDISGFPQDPLASGFDNVGAALTFSPTQLELYLDTAKQVMQKALVEGSPPSTIRWRFEIDAGDSDSHRVQVDGQRPIVNGGKNPVVEGFKVLHHESWDKKLNVRDFAMKEPGSYRVRIRAAGRIPDRDEVVRSAREILQKRFDDQMTKTPDREKWHRQQLDRDLQHFASDAMYRYGPPRLKLIQELGGQPRTIAEFDVSHPRSNPHTYEIPVEFTTQKAGLTIEYAYSIPKVLENFWMQGNDAFARPELFVDWLEIEGPLVPSWPPPSHQSLLLPHEGTNSSTGPIDRKQAMTAIETFTTRAFRRPVTEQDVAPYKATFEASKKEGMSDIGALRNALSAVLVSPNFLFLAEESETERLSAYALASRLSYFLWSSCPDQALLDAAARGELKPGPLLRHQVERMLADPKSEELVRNFTDQWLGLREVGANPPAPDLYPHYDRHLEISMIEEGRALFRTILRDEKSVLDFIDPDYLVINERLARFYEIEGIRGDAFQQVALPKESPRGGILTQTAMLSITSNGTRTSPVKRGTWVLKNILGTDPGLPVANAGDIAPKVPGIDKATVRDRLEIHRELPQCARCHDKIDPLGLALENFNASGQYRKQEGFGYKGRIEKEDPIIDASAKLPDGTLIQGPVELKKAIRKQEDKFLNCLAGKLLTYAVGRELTIADEPTVREIISETKGNGSTLKELILAVTSSSTFHAP
ncbi:hypothetical protein VN12_04885 [Pirellula sp. SH-Sr6A]|uniref:DUF1592 domain-containing protein n=1 Tax=Pirellula sp. SH-Sr6A TaxID=1632865 RepID=UPI00078B8639|nr:DUF1592 domain-containing protein [Pirellula sp. SH-Sr6A]AMV31431.1 hypothetical protein VN12_04885 [Pirellula sp. SH-Sr6A]